MSIRAPEDLSDTSNSAGCLIKSDVDPKNRIGAVLRVGPAILKGSDVKDSTIPLLVDSTGVGVNISAGVW